MTLQYSEEEIIKLQRRIEGWNRKEEALLRWYEKENSNLTSLGKIQLKNHFQAEIKKIRYNKKQCVESIRMRRRT